MKYDSLLLLISLPYCDVDSTVAVVDVFDIRVAELLHCNICVEL